MNETILPQGYKLVLGRRRTRVITYENLRIRNASIRKKDKPKKKKETSPSVYSDYNYYKRIKQRREKIKELAYNNFEFDKSVMITLTFDIMQTDLTESHRKFKKFIQRIHSHYDNFRYLSTFNKQNNGNWHYHMLCNLASTTKNSTIRDLWGHGITYITRFHNENKFTVAINYLVFNMISSSEDKKGRHGYLSSDSLEKNIVITSYKEKDIEQFDEVFPDILESKRKILYSTQHHLGIKKEIVNEETGEVVNYTIPNKEWKEELEKAGFESWDSIFTYVASSAKFKDKFSILQTATLKEKKFKKKRKRMVELMIESSGQ